MKNEESQLKWALIQLKPNEESAINALNSLEEILEYSTNHLSTEEINDLQHLFADAPPISGQHIEVGDFDPSIPLPKLKDLTRAN